MPHQGWNNYILRSFAGDVPPTEWVQLLTKITSILEDRFTDKVELVSFVTKGDRKARWLLQPTDPEYCTKNEAFNVAKKLVFLLLNSLNGAGVSTDLTEDFPTQEFEIKTTICPLCKKDIDISDFDRDGRSDLNSIQIGHDVPISRQANSHNKDNVFWIHRRCNYIKGEQSLKEAMENLVEIIKSHLS